MTKAPEVSVIMANHNGSAYLEGAIAAVLSQSFVDLELILSDDASTDSSLDIVSRIRDPRLRVITSKQNAGPGAARNKALELARGPWVAIVDADDLMHPDRFQVLLNAAQASKQPIIADNQKFFEGDGLATGETLYPTHERPIIIDTAVLLASEFAGTPNRLGYLKPMIRRDALDGLCYRSDLRVGEDFDLLLRLTMAGHSLTLIPDALYYYRRRDTSTSHRLAPEQAKAMMNALCALDTQDPVHIQAIHARIKALQHRMNLETTVQDIKSWHLGRAAAGIIRHPSVIPALGGIAKGKLVGKAAPAQSGGAHLPSAPKRTGTKVHIRVPTYKRPEQLRRALKCLQAQTEPDWLCDVYDDDPERTGASVVDELKDARIRYHANPKNLMASHNIDQCFSKVNPYGADYFCVLEDDNQLFPTHLTDNIQILKQTGVEIVLRNQLVEYASGTDAARLSKTGLLETKFEEGVYSPERFHLALIADMGVSNGGLFWSKNATSDLEIGEPISATLQEYLRTFAIGEPIYVAMTPTAVWAENGENTTRDLGLAVGWFRRELALKRSVQILQRLVWRTADKTTQADFVKGIGFNYPARIRASGLVKSHTCLTVGQALSMREKLRLAWRGALIRWVGRPEPGLSAYLKRSINSPAQS